MLASPEEAILYSSSHFRDWAPATSATVACEYTEQCELLSPMPAKWQELRCCWLILMHRGVHSMVLLLIWSPLCALSPRGPQGPQDLPSVPATHKAKSPGSPSVFLSLFLQVRGERPVGCRCQAPPVNLL